MNENLKIVIELLKGRERLMNEKYKQWLLGYGLTQGMEGAIRSIMTIYPTSVIINKHNFYGTEIYN